MGLSHRASLYFSTSKISLFLSLPLSLVHLSICTVTTHILSVKLACCCDTGASIYLSICKCRSTLTHTHSEKLPFCVCVCKIHVLLCVPLFGLALLTQMVISGDYLCMYLLLHPAALLGRSGPTNHSTTSILLLQETQTDTQGSPRRI